VRAPVVETAEQVAVAATGEAAEGWATGTTNGPGADCSNFAPIAASSAAVAAADGTRTGSAAIAGAVAEGVLISRELPETRRRSLSSGTAKSPAPRSGAAAEPAWRDGVGEAKGSDGANAARPAAVRAPVVEAAEQVAVAATEEAADGWATGTTSGPGADCAKFAPIATGSAAAATGSDGTRTGSAALAGAVAEGSRISGELSTTCGVLGSTRPSKSRSASA